MKTLLLIAAALCALAMGGPALAAAPDLGSNVKIITPGMTVSQIKAVVDPIGFWQNGNEFGTPRYAVLFMPGTYGTAAAPLNFQLGYYEEVAGLGALPGGVTVNGTVDSFNRCPQLVWCHSLVNFHRSLGNLTLNVAGKTGCYAGKETWAVSQQSPMRRVQVNGAVALSDECGMVSLPLANGAHIADSRITGTVTDGHQQQSLVRDSSIGGWSGGMWNHVFVGAEGAPASGAPITTVDRMPVTQERPFLYVDGAAWKVYVPSRQLDTRGVSWAAGQTPGVSVPIESFFIAKPTNTVAQINAALASCKSVLFTPGIYKYASPVSVTCAGTVVLGLGYATLDVTGSNSALTVADVPGVTVSGLIFDGGATNAAVQVRVDGDGAALHDLTFRLGGPHVGRATVGLVVNGDGAFLDDLWAWRADHGTGVGWTSNTGQNGIVVNGANVVAAGLYSEHYQQHATIWNGDGGQTFFAEAEGPYDAPSQAAFTQPSGQLGWAAYKVADSVLTHAAFGLEDTALFRDFPAMVVRSAVEVPDRPGVTVQNVATVSSTNLGRILHGVNLTGPATPTDSTPVFLASYP